MLDILSVIPGKKRSTSSGWVTFNAVCCVHRGHSADKRSRGGIKWDGPQKWSYNCFNCNFRCGHTHGQTISNKTRQLLSWCGIDEEVIQKWNLASLKNQDPLQLAAPKPRSLPKFQNMDLPPDSTLLDPNNPQHVTHINYLASRGFRHDSYPFMVTPNAPGRNRNRIIIPYTHKKKIVGYTSRYCDVRTPKYINMQQPGYVFGLDLQRNDSQIVIVVEGVFDALAIGGVATLHNTVSEAQMDLINSLYRKVIVVPDQDRSGLELCERALECGWSVSIPPWHSGIKDVNDALVKYGEVATLLSIIQAATSSKIKVDMLRRKIDAR